jgi:hypothetical protein
MVAARTALALSFLLVVTACSNPGSSATLSDTATGGGLISIPNQGGAMEGHTPTGFAGTGTGLFAGDNLNPSFPEGQGVQTYLTFALPADITVISARITSNVLETIGSPFEDLGLLLVEPVEYSSFGPEIFDLPALDNSVRCRVIGESSIECDVTSAVQAAVIEGGDTVQFRLRFERPADNDGQPDLAMFFRSDSNTNESGLFDLTLTPIP